MKPRFILSLLLPLALLGPALAAEKTPLMVANAAEVRRDEVVARIQKKIDGGAKAAADFAPELKLLEEHAAMYAKYPELVADFAMVKAALYLDGLEDRAEGRKLLAAVRRDFPGTPAAEQAAQTLDTLDRDDKRSAADADLLPLAQGITAKATAGTRGEAAFSAELAKFDALLAKYAGNHEAAGNIALAKAMFYIRVLQDPVQGRKLLQAVPISYPDTLASASAQDLLDRLAESGKR